VYWFNEKHIKPIICEFKLGEEIKKIVDDEKLKGEF
jgi:hypothetical protein